MVRVLGAELDIRQIESLSVDRTQGEAVLQLKYRIGSGPIQLNVQKERRVQLKQALRANTVAVLIKIAVTAPQHNAIRHLVREPETGSEIVEVRVNQSTVKPPGSVACGGYDSAAIGGREVCGLVIPVPDWREQFITQTVGQREFRCRLPGVHGIERVTGLEVVNHQRRCEVHAVDVPEQEIG